ncbi:MAG: DUF2284 domain-containing protein [Deferrisomatales bacterium]|nr:DUF2284 domain-containing protein [Deferrisomatales bacterium]
MKTADLRAYVDAARGFGATDAKVIHPETVVTAPWVRWKCRFGCPGFGGSHCCPPDTPDDTETRRLLDSYQRAILFHREAPREPGRGERCQEYFAKLVELEGTVFKNGYYKALVMLAGPCRWCAECAKTQGNPCNFGAKARPSMESCGIDVFQTARNHGLFIETLREKTETQNLYSLLLVD